jgi:choice-of-anchor A domain-containing protein
MNIHLGVSGRLVPSAALVATVLCGISPLVQPAAASASGVVLAANSCALLPASFGYTEYATGNVTEAHGDSDGPTAFGGTSQLSNFAISESASLLPASDVGFVAGGPVTGNNTTSVHLGNAYADASVTGVSYQAGVLNSVSQANLPVNFATTATADATLSSQLAALPTSPGDTANTSSSTLTLAATQTESDNQYVWTLTPGELASITSILVTGVPAGGNVVVNIPDTGAVALTVSSITLDGVSAAPSTGPAPALADTTIFNFSGATSLGLTGAWAGTLFAPGAAVTFSSGHLWGSVIAGSLTGTNESTYGPLGSGLCLNLPGPGPALAEGQPLYLAGGGAAVLGTGFLVMLRRRSRRHGTPGMRPA